MILEINPARAGFPSLTFFRDGKIYLSRELVESLHLEAGRRISFFEEIPDGEEAAGASRYYMKTVAGKIPLRGLPNRNILVCNNQAFVHRLWRSLPGAPALFRCLVCTRLDDNNMYQIMIEKSL